MWPQHVNSLTDAFAGEEVSGINSSMNDEAIGCIAQYLVNGDLQIVRFRFSIESHCVNGRLETVQESLCCDDLVEVRRIIRVDGVEPPEPEFLEQLPDLFGSCFRIRPRLSRSSGRGLRRGG